MEEPIKKLKKILIIVGITGAVYASFKYLLPLVIPFFIAYGLALFLRRPVMWMHRRLYVIWKRKVLRFPIALAGILMMLWLLGLLAAGFYLGGCRLAKEANALMNYAPVLIEKADIWITESCYSMERFFHLREGVLVMLCKESILELGKSMKSTVMPYLVGNSVGMFQRVVKWSTFLLVVLIATILSLQEMDDLRTRRNNSIFRQEFALISRRLMLVGEAYLKTQGIIMLTTMAICTAGLYFLKNPYYILLGIGIGLLDALPIFGTGTVFIPWIAIEVLRGNWGRAVFLLVLYLICYFLREILEAKLMGGKVGLTPLETLMSIYIGLLLFGLAGFVLGPIGLLLIEDLVQAAEGSQSNSEIC